ncbi:DUF5710 domain-containing protein [Sphingobacterium sp. MYb388]|uniref:DUF5710 domain-containing protein n=1 Tax=Sphingobacterium sp. MYb388 TaxID=2745437 RepID=UPI0030ABC372
MPYKINVPYSEKDTAKAVGAFWDNASKTWYIPDHKHFNDFLKWINIKDISIILKAPYYLGLNKRECWKCSKETTVISLYSDNFYKYNDDDDTDEPAFHPVDSKSFVYSLAFIEPDVANFIHKEFQFYKLGYSKMADSTYWANHCEHCKVIQGDFHLHEEPDGAFCPIDEESCKKLTLIEMPFTYDLGLDGAFSYSSNEDEIFELAKKVKWENFKENK